MRMQNEDGNPTSIKEHLQSQIRDQATKLGNTNIKISWTTDSPQITCNQNNTRDSKQQTK